MKLIPKIHRHDWMFRSVDRLTNNYYTLVLWVCDGCGKTKTTQLSGEWEADDLKDTRP